MLVRSRSTTRHKSSTIKASSNKSSVLKIQAISYWQAKITTCTVCISLSSLKSIISPSWFMFMTSIRRFKLLSSKLEEKDRFRTKLLLKKSAGLQLDKEIQ